jgi:hypothetical protein
MKRIIITLAFVFTVQQAAAETDKEHGLHLMEQAEARDKGFSDYLVEGSMTVKSPSGSTAFRRFTMRTLEMQTDGDKRLTTFVEPRDLTGLTSLIHSHVSTSDDQWIYLPSMRRTKRLAARDKTGSFAGSEFSFEDIATFEIEKYTYRYVGEDTVDGNKCSLVEMLPTYEYSGYSKLIECLDLTIYQPRRIQYFDLVGRPYKELAFFDYKQFINHYWRPMRVSMHNIQSNAVSSVEWSQYRFQTGLTEADFRPHVLGRFS